MREKTKLLGILLLVLLTAASCSDDGASSGKDDHLSTDRPSTNTGNETEPFLKDNLPADLDYQGMPVNIVYYDGYCTKELTSENKGDVVNDAVQKRNSNVEERLNIQLNMVNSKADWVGMGEYISRLASSGDNTYDIVDGFQYAVSNLIFDGSLANLSDSEYLDIEQPWWATNYINEMRIGNDTLFCVAGSANMGMTDQMSCIFFNKSVLKDYSSALNLDENGIYQMVMDQKWTMDRMYEFSKSCYSDVNGDSKYDSDDIYGLGTITGNLSWHTFIDAGGRFTERGEDGIPVLCAENEQNVDIIDKILTMYKDPSIYFAEASEAGLTELINMFAEDRLLFKIGFFNDVYKMRDMESEYGILPCAKYDEQQEDYLSLIHDCATLFVVPASCNDVEFSCVILEALASESLRTVTPAYYEIALKTKYVSDSNAGKVIDMIQQSATSDFGFIFSTSLKSLVNTLVSDVVQSGNNIYSSRWKSIKKKAEKGMTKLLEAYTEN